MKCPFKFEYVLYTYLQQRHRSSLGESFAIDPQYRVRSASQNGLGHFLDFLRLRYYHIRFMGVEYATSFRELSY